MTKQTAIYVRVSTAGQDSESQLPDLKAYEKGVEGPVKWFEDTASGKTMDRPGWLALEAEIRAGKVGAVITWRLDRLGRTAAGLTALFEELGQRKVNLVSLKDGLDLSTPAGRLMANVLASVAAYETEVRGERVKAGQAAARAKGKQWGGSKPGKRKRVTSEKAAVIRAMRAGGDSIAKIARMTAISRPTIYSLLRESSSPTA